MPSINDVSCEGGQLQTRYGAADELFEVVVDPAYGIPVSDAFAILDSGNNMARAFEHVDNVQDAIDHWVGVFDRVSPVQSDCKDATLDGICFAQVHTSFIKEVHLPSGHSGAVQPGTLLKPYFDASIGGVSSKIFEVTAVVADAIGRVIKTSPCPCPDCKRPACPSAAAAPAADGGSATAALTLGDAHRVIALFQSPWLRIA